MRDDKSGERKLAKSETADEKKQTQMQAAWDDIEKKARAENQAKMTSATGGRAKTKAKAKAKAKASKHSKKGLSKSAKVALVVVAIIAIVALIIAGICLFTDVDDNIINDFKYSDNTQIDSQSQALSMIETGDYDRVIWWYNKQIKETTDDQEKAELYLAAANVIAAGSQSDDQDALQQALDYALKAEELSPSIGSAVSLETIYQELGDNDNMTKYGNLAQERIEAENGDQPIESLS